MDGFVYLWYDRKKKRYCLGSHYGTLDDGYITSTGYMKNAYKNRPQDFRRRILEVHYGTRKELLEKEQKWLNLICETELCSKENRHSKYYNYKKNASGLSGKVASDLRKDYYETDNGKEWKNELSNRMKQNNPMRDPRVLEKRIGQKRTEESKQKMAEVQKRNWSEGKFDKVDYSKSEEHRRKLSESMKGRTLTEEHKRKISESGKGRKQSDYQKQSAREANMDMTIYTFENKNGTVFTGTAYDLRQTYDLDQGNLSKVVSGKSESTKGWKIKRAT